METTDPLRALARETATDVYYYGDAGTEREWRQCRFCLAYAEGEVGSKPTPRHGEPCPVGDLEHICDDTCPANEYHERTHAPLALHAASAPPLSEWICEQHPELDWPHDDCAGPGMPKSAQVTALIYQRDQARLEHQETRGTVAALKQKLREQASPAFPPPPLSPDSRSKLIAARNDLMSAITSLRGGHSAVMDTCDEAIAALDIAIGQAFASPASPPRACINCSQEFVQSEIRYYYGVPDEQVGPLCESCDTRIKQNIVPDVSKREPPRARQPKDGEK